MGVTSHHGSLLFRDVIVCPYLIELIYASLPSHTSLAVWTLFLGHILTKIQNLNLHMFIDPICINHGNSRLFGIPQGQRFFTCTVI